MNSRPPPKASDTRPKSGGNELLPVNGKVFLATVVVVVSRPPEVVTVVGMVVDVDAVVPSVTTVVDSGIVVLVDDVLVVAVVAVVPSVTIVVDSGIVDVLVEVDVDVLVLVDMLVLVEVLVLVDVDVLLCGTVVEVDVEVDVLDVLVLEVLVLDVLVDEVVVVVALPRSHRCTFMLKSSWMLKPQKRPCRSVRRPSAISPSGAIHVPHTVAS